MANQCAQKFKIFINQDLFLHTFAHFANNANQKIHPTTHAKAPRSLLGDNHFCTPSVPK